MKAAVVYRPGGPEVLTLEDRPIPNIKEGWTLVKVLGFGINHSEIFTRQGLSPSVQFPRILGIECVGEILQTTNTQLETGQLILSFMGEMGRDFDGSYAEYVLLPNKQIYPVSSHLSLESLIALPETVYTAYGSFQQLKIKEKNTVLVRGATSGVGVTFAKLIKAAFPKIHLAGTSRKTDKTDLLKSTGFDEMILDKDNTLKTEKSFDRIFDLIGPKAFEDNLIHLNNQGIMCTTGLLGGQWSIPNLDPIEQLGCGVYLTAFHSGFVNKERIQEMINFVEKHHIDITPEKIFSLDQIQEAHAYLESRQSFGKIIVKL